jgi:hypothetical protein
VPKYIEPITPTWRYFQTALQKFPSGIRSPSSQIFLWQKRLLVLHSSISEEPFPPQTILHFKTNIQCFYQLEFITMKSTTFRDMTPTERCKQHAHWRARSACYLLLVGCLLRYFSTLKKEAICFVCRQTSTRLHSITFHKIVLFIVTAVRTFNSCYKIDIDSLFAD